MCSVLTRFVPKLIKLNKTKRYQWLLKPKGGSIKIRSGQVVLKKGEDVGNPGRQSRCSYTYEENN